MTTSSSGFQSSTTPSTFMGLTVPVYLPTLISRKGEDSPFLPMAHHTQAANISGILDLAPERQGVDFGQVDHFKVMNDDTSIFKSVTICLKLDGLTPGTGATSSNIPRYADDVIAQAIEKVEFTVGGVVLQTLYGDELHFRQLAELKDDELARRYKLQGAGLTRYERAALAESAHWVYYEIPFWWTRNSSTAWHQWAFKNPQRIVIHWRNPSYILQQDTVNSLPTPKLGGNYILDHYLRFHTATATDATKSVYRSMVESQNPSGWLQMVEDWERVTELNLPQGTTSNNFLLNSHNKYIYNMRFWVRPVANLMPNVLNNKRFVIKDLSSVSFTVGGKTFLPEIDDFYLKNVMNAKMFEGNAQNPIYNIPFTDYPDLHQHAMGGFDFVNANNPTLILKHDFLDQAYVMDVYLYAHNYVRLILAGTHSGASLVQSI